MTYSVVIIETLRTVIDDNGYPHNYGSKKQATKVCDKLNEGLSVPRYKVIPV